MDTCQATSTAELLRIKPGSLAVGASLILQAVDGPFEKVNQKGKTFSWAILNCCNDAEERVKVVIFSPLADNVQQEFEVHSLIRFETFDAKPILDPNDLKRRYGSLDYELLGGFSSTMNLIRPNYRPSKGMPYSTVAELDFTKPLSRHKLGGVLLSDMRPYGKGLVGEARLVDTTGTLDVQLRILQVAPVQKTVFRGGSKVVFKGSLSKCYEVVNFVVDQSSDVDFLDQNAVDKDLAKDNSETRFRQELSEPMRHAVASSPSVAKDSAKAPQKQVVQQLCAPSTSQGHLKKKISGLLVVDFERTSMGLQGLLYANRVTYDVHILDAPDGSETCLADGQEGTFFGYIEGDILTVHQWEDVDFYGADRFKIQVQSLPTAYSTVSDITDGDHNRLHKLRLKLIKVGTFSPSFTFVALLHDANGRRMVLAVKAPQDVGLSKQTVLVYGVQLDATGRVSQEGNEHVLTVDDIGRINFDFDPLAAATATVKVPNGETMALAPAPALQSLATLDRTIKQEKFDVDDPANPARNSAGGQEDSGVHGEIVIVDDSSPEDVKPNNAKKRRAKKNPASAASACKEKKSRTSTGNALSATIANNRTRRTGSSVLPAGSLTDETNDGSIVPSLESSPGNVPLYLSTDEMNQNSKKDVDSESASNLLTADAAQSRSPMASEVV